MTPLTPADLHEMAQEQYEACVKNGADLTAAGYRLRLAATRIAIRFRHPQTGARLWCHQREYRAVYAASCRKMRRIIRRLELDTAPAVR